MGDRTRGLYGKFIVRRVDGTDAPGGKHEGCEYLVLDINHDPHGREAALTYAASARLDGYDFLADDIVEMVGRHEAPRVYDEREADASGDPHGHDLRADDRD